MTFTLGALLEAAMRRHATAPAVSCGTTTVTFGDLADRAGRLASALGGAGIRPGDRVASFVTDDVEAVELFVACALGGFTLVPVNARFRAGEATHVVHDCAAAALVYSPALAPVAAGIDGLDDLRLVAMLDRCDPTPDRVPGSLSVAELVADARPLVGPREVDPDDIAIIAYTSGTTGFPKGALVSHRAAVLATRLVPFVQGMVGHGSCTFVGSFSFVSALWGILYPHLFTGGHLRVVEPTDIDEWLDAMAADRATYTWVPSPLLVSFGHEIGRRPDVLEHLRTVVHTGSKVPADHLEALVDVVGDRLVETWGMTETVGPVTATTRSDFHGSCDAEDLYGSVGRPVATAEVAVLDSDGRVTHRPGVTGELLARTDTIFSGYLGRRADDPEHHVGSWFRTGDVGHIDPAGYVTIEDRCKDVIVSGGMNVYPTEIELTLATMPGVVECAVCGVPDERWGETVAAAVVAPGAGIDADEVIAWVRDRLASYKKPTRVAFVEALPRNASMKVQKDLVRQVFTDHP